MAQTTLTVPFRAGYNFGVGVDLLSGEPRNQSVNSDVINTVNEGNRGSGIVVQRIHTTQDLEQILGIDAEASFGSASFAGKSARFDFAKACRVESSSLFMAINARVALKVLSIDAPSLTKEASAVVDRPDIFAKRFGDVFVRSMELGGIFVGVIRIETFGSTEFQDISANLEGVFPAEAQVELSEKFATIARDFHSETFVHMYREGGPVDLAITADRDPKGPLELLINANRFLDSFATNSGAIAVPYVVTLAPITLANGPLPPNVPDVERAQDVMQLCATQRSVLLDQLNVLQLFVDRPDRYDFSNGANANEIATAAANTQTDLDLIERCASAAINSPSEARFPKDFAVAVGETFPKAAMPAILPAAKPRPPEEKTKAKFPI